MKNIFVVIPVANEEAVIEKNINDILSLNIPNFNLAIVMDDYSKDKTSDIVKRLSELDNRIHLVFHEKSTGVVSCYLHGFKHALANGADYVIEMDSGGSHDHREIPKFIQYLDQGYDCVFGSRFMRRGAMVNHPLYRRLISWGGTILSNVFLGTKLKDMTSGYEAFNRQVLEMFDFDRFHSRGHIYQTEMRFYCRNFRIIEIPIIYRGTKSSIKTKSVIEAFKVLSLLIIERFARQKKYLQK